MTTLVETRTSLLDAIKPYLSIAPGDFFYHEYALARLEKEYHPVFEQHGNKTRWAWANDPGEPKHPVSKASRRFIFVPDTFTGMHNLIVRGPSNIPHIDPGWVVYINSAVRSLEDFINVLTLPHVGILHVSYSAGYRYIASGRN